MSTLNVSATELPHPARTARRTRETALFLAKRIAVSCVTLLVSTFLIFSSLYIAPGDPVAALSKGRTLSPELVASLRAEYHLDDPFFERYLQWLSDVAHGNLGHSLMYGESVTSLIGQRAAVTFELAAYAGLLIIILGVGSGVLAGLRRGVVDQSIIIVTTVFAAVPAFVSAIVLLNFMVVQLGWFPALGAGDGFLDRLRHLTLPAVALALTGLAVVSRVTRAAVRTELSREHVQTAVSRGIPYRLTVRRHVLRNAMIPVTTVVGLSVASLVALTAIVEQAFSLNGLGAALVQAASYSDFPVVQGIGLVYVVVFMIANTAVDLAYGFLDPRVSMGGSQ
jgi:peptide/nickel transport system permease protein